MKEILSQIRLLYVEDDANIRKVLSRGLKRRVKDIAIAIDGEDGLMKYKSFKPDIIVTDIKMPKMSGLEMSKKIRELDISTPIIVTSAHSDSDILLEAIEIGVNGYVLKPINKDKLIQTIYNYSKVKILEKEIKLKDKQLITQAKELALSELIKNISHQWRQPLSIITTLASILDIKNDNKELDTKFIKKSLSQIIKTAENLSEIINLFYNANSKKEDMKKSFNILVTINNILLKLKSKLLEDNIEVILDIEDININSVENIINIIIENILLNSIEILKSKDIEFKYIFINIKYDNGYLDIIIKDNGGGIDNNIIDKVFEPYFTTHHQSQGKGLGLYTVKIMLDKYLNGDIYVENEEYTYNGNKYIGAIFKINLNIDNN